MRSLGRLAVVLIVLLAAVPARADGGSIDIFAEEPVWKQMGYKSQKEYSDERVATHCSKLWGWARFKHPWTPGKQKSCERAVKSGNFDLWQRQHASWWRELN